MKNILGKNILEKNILAFKLAFKNIFGMKVISLYIIGILAILIVAFISLNIGQYKITLGEVFRILGSYFSSSVDSGGILESSGATSALNGGAVSTGDSIKSNADMISYVIFSQRFPRIILAIFVGAGLAISSVSFQNLFKNPLATPDILGTSAAASFGVVLGLLMGFSQYLMGIFGFIFGLISLVLIILLSNEKQNANASITMVLSGVIIGALFQSLVSLLKYLADPQDELPTITYWLLGSLNYTNSVLMITGLIGITIGIIAIFVIKWKLNLLLLNDDEAHSLGLNIRYFKIYVIFFSTLIVSCCISMCGIIGWIGLLVSFIARLIVGNENSKLIPLSAFIGAIAMIIIDTISRTISTEQIPISILTSIIGAPFFIFILYKTKGLKL